MGMASTITSIIFYTNRVEVQIFKRTLPEKHSLLFNGHGELSGFYLKGQKKTSLLQSAHDKEVTLYFSSTSKARFISAFRFGKLINITSIY